MFLCVIVCPVWVVIYECQVIVKTQDQKSQNLHIIVKCSKNPSLIHVSLIFQQGEGI